MSTIPSMAPGEIRTAVPDDLSDIHDIHVQAFGGRQDEANLVDLLHAAKKAEPSLVAACEGKIVAHVIFSPMSIDPARQDFKVAGLGPVGVLPAYQRRGIGSQLIRAGIAASRQAGLDAVAVLGSPKFYTRFGFRPAMNYGLTNEYV